MNVGRVPVYLLDTNLPENEPHYPRPDARVYGGDSTTRIMQEILLGVGGVRLLRALGVQPSVFHMNEGHAAFLTLELMREKMAAGKIVAGGDGGDDGRNASSRRTRRSKPVTTVSASDLMDYAVHRVSDAVEDHA